MWCAAKRFSKRIKRIDSKEGREGEKEREEVRGGGAQRREGEKRHTVKQVKRDSIRVSLARKGCYLHGSLLRFLPSVI